MSDYELIDMVEVGNHLGEGVQWHREQQALWWTDITQAKLYQYHWPRRELNLIEMPEAVGSFAFIEGSDDIVAAFASGIGRYSFASGEVSWFARPAMSKPNVRFNDGRVDRQGRFWAGTMDPDFSPREMGEAKLYCLDSQSVVSEHQDNLYIANGACWSPGGERFYFADSPRREMYCYDFDTERGLLVNRQVFARTPEGGFPDGACVDAAGFVWSAHWGIGQVRRYTPEGEVDKIIELPVQQPSCVAFGGEQLDILFVNSAQQDLTPQQLAAQPQAGHLFAFQTDSKGLPESKYMSAL